MEYRRLWIADDVEVAEVLVPDYALRIEQAEDLRIEAAHLVVTRRGNAIEYAVGPGRKSVDFRVYTIDYEQDSLRLIVCKPLRVAAAEVVGFKGSDNIIDRVQDGVRTRVDLEDLVRVVV